MHTGYCYFGQRYPFPAFPFLLSTVERAEDAEVSPFNNVKNSMSSGALVHIPLISARTQEADAGGSLESSVVYRVSSSQIPWLKKVKK